VEKVSKGLEIGLKAKPLSALVGAQEWLMAI